MQLHQTNDLVETACREIVNILSSRGSLTKSEFVEIQKEVCHKYGINAFPSNIQLLKHVGGGERGRLVELLKVKPVRTASGIAVITAMTKPYPCPHGVCIYCPGGVKAGTPQSYLKNEPATLRAEMHDYDPFRQVASKLEELRAGGHVAGKVELLIIGGTFLNFPLGYQRSFVKGCLDALNGFSAASLEEAINANELARVRNVGLSVETRPDLCKKQHVDSMLSYGTTRVEIGVQCLDDQIYRFVNRGHTLADVVEAFRVARDAGLKIVAHMMPGLPGSDPQKDLEDFRTLFDDERFKPDMLKIYPTLVLEGTGLFKLFLEGKYEPYSLETVVRLLAEAKRNIPRWVRVMRIQREISSHHIIGGVKRGNLRELVLAEMSGNGFRCKCIRCREVGLKQIRGGDTPPMGNFELCREDYLASGSTETFLSYEDMATDSLAGFLRLRLPSKSAHRIEVVGERSCIVRELHVYGPSIQVGSRDERAWQHKGFGAKLMSEAEQIAFEEFDAKRMLVISAIGTREYYQRLGYEPLGPYMAKNLASSSTSL